MDTLRAVIATVIYAGLVVTVLSMVWFAYWLIYSAIRLVSAVAKGKTRRRKT